MVKTPARYAYGGRFRKLALLGMMLAAMTSTFADQTVTKLSDANPGAEFRALVIGNSRSLLSDVLPGVENDAHDIAKLLTEIGFTISNKGALTNLSRRRMEEEFNAFQLSLKPNTVAVIYYSGHGVEEGGTNFLVPTDSPLGRKADIHNNLVSLGGWLNTMRDLEVRSFVVILDACRDLPQELTYKGLSGGGGLTAIRNQTSGETIIFAASPGRKALAARATERNSVFTGSFLQAARENWSTFDQVVDRAAELTAERTDSDQVPYRAGAIGMSFRFTRLGSDSRPTPSIFNNSVPPIELGQGAMHSFLEACEEVSKVDYSTVPPRYSKEKRCRKEGP